MAKFFQWALLFIMGIIATHHSWAMGALSMRADMKDAVILIYHRFGESDFPSTNIRLDQFEKHLASLQDDGIRPVALSEIISAFQENRSLPKRAMAVTVDDAYTSFAETAWPRLKRAGIPVTLFVATDPVDQKLPGYLSWDEIRRLAKEGVTIGHHGAAHLHMVDAGLSDARADIERATKRFEDELGFRPDLFAYPYGEYSPALMEMVKELGFDAALAQYSGVAAAWDNPFAMPRFAMNETYADADRFRLIISAKALPVTAKGPKTPVIDAAKNPPDFHFRPMIENPNLSALSCFASHEETAALLKYKENGKVHVQIKRPFPAGRSRVNCTMPAGEGRWYWLGQFFYRPGSPD